MTQHSEDQIKEIGTTVKEIKDCLLGNREYRIEGLVGKFESMSNRLDSFNSRLSELEENQKKQKYFAMGMGAVGSIILWVLKLFLP